MISPRNKDATDHRVSTSTIHAHSLAQYATTESNEKGELMWIALSWFMEKTVSPIRLDSREMLLEFGTRPAGPTTGFPSNSYRTRTSMPRSTSAKAGFCTAALY